MLKFLRVPDVDAEPAQVSSSDDEWLLDAFMPVDERTERLWLLYQIPYPDASVREFALRCSPRHNALRLTLQLRECLDRKQNSARESERSYHSGRSYRLVGHFQRKEHEIDATNSTRSRAGLRCVELLSSNSAAL